MGFKLMVSVFLIVTLLLTMGTITRAAYGDTRTSSNLTSPANPHWVKNQCKACHVTEGKNIVSRLLKTERDGLCLDCHKDDIAHVYIHPIGLSIPKEKRALTNKQWGDELRLDDDSKMTCLTCHDLLDQCLPERSHQLKRNPRFLRGGPYPNRSDLCYRCHDSSKYERKSPHDQIAENGALKVKNCRLCHEIDINKKLKSGIDRDIGQYPLIKGLNHDRTLLCIRCHRKIDHPSNSVRIKSNKKYRHLVKIGKYEKQTLEKLEKSTGIELPLEPNTDRIYCGTCHQPHQPGVFAGDDPSPFKPADHRLRSKPICKHCHDFYDYILDTGTQ